MLTAFTNLDPTGRVIVLAVLGTVAYLLSGLFWPYTACQACHGGKHSSPTGKNFGLCRRCRGSGKKLRLVARLLGRVERG
ncbi:hypothetical protein [Amycolatopsis minnesotensis]|uniref:Uncharacterized protein n=1 Tax=Amycolatopsis minnesotensis TaxID=337894 RepID=A0ABN2SAK1_9PSEU